jgi:hypothetical protein
MVLSHPYQTGGSHAPVVRIVQYGVRSGVARPLVGSICWIPVLSSAAILPTWSPVLSNNRCCCCAPLSPGSLFHATQSASSPRRSGFIRAARLTCETVYYPFLRQILAVPSDELPPCSWIEGMPVIHCQSGCFRPGLRHPPASILTGQPATPAQRSDPVTVLRQLRAAGQYWLYW